MLDAAIGSLHRLLKFKPEQNGKPAAASSLGGIGYVNRSGYWVGRETAQARLLTIWQQSLENVRQVVFVTGEPGIGKTTLIEMFLNQVSESLSHGFAHALREAFW